MKKILFSSLLLAMVSIMVASCSSCQSGGKPSGEANSDSANVVPMVCNIVVENCISMDRQAMLFKCNGDSSYYRWFETTAVFENPLNSGDTANDICSVTNVFQKIIEFDSGADTMVYYFRHGKDGSVEIDSVHSWYAECEPLEREPIKITFMQAYERLMNANVPKPESRYCVLRKQVGSKECNPQYIFGNYEYQVYVDGVNGNVQTENPAFGGDFGKPLGEWP